MDWSRFQLVTIASIAGLVAFRALLLWFTTRVNAFKITQPNALSFVVATAFFVLMLLRGAQLVTLPMPAPVDTMIVASDAVHRVGASLVVAGMLIFVLALFSFGNSWRVGIDVHTPGRLVTEGIFSLSRNPIFVFLDLYLVGTFFLNGTPLFLLMAFVGIAGIHRQILREETFLQERYGAAYQEYCARTSRYFGWRRRG